jgi:hypothetical protein
MIYLIPYNAKSAHIAERYAYLVTNRHNRGSIFVFIPQ